MLIAPRVQENMMANVKLAIDSLIVSFVFLLASTYWRVDEHVAHSLIMVALISILLSNRRTMIRGGFHLLPLGTFGAFLGWLSISVFWSPNFALSVNYALLVVLGAANAVLLGVLYGLRTIALGIVLGTTIILAHGWVLNLSGQDDRMEFLQNDFGNFTNPSSLSLIVGAALALVPFIPGRSPWGLVLKAGVGALFIYVLSELLILTSFFSLFAALLVGLGLWHLRSLNDAKRTPFFLLYVGLAVSLVTLFWVFRAPILAPIGEDENLSERVPLWGLFFEALMWRPVIGAGWGNTVGWDFPLEPSRLYPVSDFFPAHNGYLDTGLMLGLVGVIGLASTIVAVYIRGFRVAMTDDNRPEMAAIVVLLTYLVVNDIMATSFPRFIGIFFLGVLVGQLMVSRMLVGSSRSEPCGSNVHAMSSERRTPKTAVN